IQKARVIVIDHREQARSYRWVQPSTGRDLPGAMDLGVAGKIRIDGLGGDFLDRITLAEAL
ncbi:hypothetical protein ACCD00_03985, partial [Pseudomonas sp. Pseusp3]